MSTRSRILLALLALTLAPLLAVAVWACAHAVRWSPDAIQLRLARSSVQGALDVRARRAAALGALAGLGDRLSASSPDPDSATIAAAVAAWPGAAQFASLEIRAGEGVRYATGFALDVAGPDCTDVDAIPLEADAGPLHLTGMLPTATLLDHGTASPDDPRLALLDADGRAVADPWCLGPAGRLPARAAGMRTPQLFAVDVGQAGWTVVGLPAPGWPRPFPPRGLALLLAAVFIAITAAGAFVILVRDLYRSMDVLTSAAARIGQGDFSPWLPPPAHDEVGRLSFAIGTMAARLEQVMQQNARNRQMAAIGELASHVSHEIRNPLSSIKLNLQSVDREMRTGAVPADLPAVLQLCLREVHRLDGTVQGVLRLAGTGEPLLAPCDLHVVLRDAVETVRPQLESHRTGVTLQLDAAAATVRADAVQLRGVILNLLLNAHDAMGPDGHIEIRSEVSNDAARPLVRIHFTDSGPGIRPEDRERVFQPFFSTKPTGTGIGLPLALRVVEAHGGRLYLERRSELEAGAEFVLELPLDPVAEPAGGGATPDREAHGTRWRPPSRRRSPEFVA